MGGILARGRGGDGAGAYGSSSLDCRRKHAHLCATPPRDRARLDEGSLSVRGALAECDMQPPHAARCSKLDAARARSPGVASWPGLSGVGGGVDVWCGGCLAFCQASLESGRSLASTLVHVEGERAIGRVTGRPQSPPPPAPPSVLRPALPGPRASRPLRQEAGRDHQPSPATPAPRPGPIVPGAHPAPPPCASPLRQWRLGGPGPGAYPQWPLGGIKASSLPRLPPDDIPAQDVILRPPVSRSHPPSLSSLVARACGRREAAAAAASAHHPLIPIATRDESAIVQRKQTTMII